jgi:hypothetical protein
MSDTGLLKDFCFDLLSTDDIGKCRFCQQEND